MRQKRDRLDALLRDWTERRAPCRESRDVQRERILRSMEAQRPAVCNEDRALFRDRPRRAVWFLLGAATAACVLAWIAVLPRSTPRAVTADPNAAVIEELQPQQLDEYAGVLREDSRMFPGQLNWLAETNQSVQLGISSDAAVAGAPSSHPIVVRLTVTSRPRGQTQWKTIWVADVITYEEEQVVFRREDPRTLVNLWTHRLPDDKLFVDTDLTLPGTKGPFAQTSILPMAGKATRIMTLEESQQEYQVFQAVAQLAKR